MSVKNQVKALWKLCFDDSDEFTDLYFRMRYTDEINSFVERDGKVVAALQRIPYPMTYGGETVSMSYISGACTHPAHRGKGLMRGLLAQSHRRMYEDGALLSTLIPAEPWLRDYYAKSGYFLCFKQDVKLLTPRELSVDNYKTHLIIKPISLLKEIPGEVYSFFNSQLAGSLYRVQHTAEDFRVILADLHLSGGTLWAAYGENGLCGLCFCLFQGSTLSVKALFCRDVETEQVFLTRLMRHYKVDSAECTYTGKDATGGLGMARVINAEAMLSLLARRENGIYLCIEGDEAVPENNGYYNLEGGRCFRGKVAGREYVGFSVAEVTELVFKNVYPVMDLMLN